MSLDAIPRADLIAILCEAAWYSGGCQAYDRQGYSFDVREETAIRDVNYRDEPLFATPQEAIVGHWQRYYEKQEDRAPERTVSRVSELP